MTTYDKAEAERIIGICRDFMPDRIGMNFLHLEAEDLANLIQAALDHIDTLTRRAQVAELELEAMRPIAIAAVRVQDLDEICDAHPSMNDPVGNAAEAEMYAAVTARTHAVHAYRSTADARNDQIAKLAGDAPR